jgi:hypothetical protein
MRNRAFSPLLEQILMIAVFALVAAVCISGFSKAYHISQQTQHTDNAVILAQNLAEDLKAGLITADETVFYDDALHPTTEAQAVYTATVTAQQTGEAGLGSACIRISHKNTQLYSLTVHWQEGLDL